MVMRVLMLGLISWAVMGAEGTLIVRVTDKASGAPLAARVSLKASDGNWRWGKDAAGADLTYGGPPRVWTTGELSLALPEGAVELVVSRPFHHKPASATATVVAGKTTTLDVALERAVDIHARGWYGGDVHVHIVHGEKEFKLDLNTVAPIARAEGQDWCSFGQAWTSLNDAQPTAAELAVLAQKNTTPDFLCAWGMEHPKDHLGHMAAFPLNAAGATKTYTEASGSNDYAAFMPNSLADGFTHVEIWRGLRAHGSLAVYTHPTREYGGTKESLGNIAREIPFDVAAAPDWIEALDLLCDQPKHADDERLAYLLLNRGLRFALCGFTDVCYDRKKNERPGDTRTYVYLGDKVKPGTPLKMDDIVAAVRARRTFATNGPLVDFTVDGEHPGAVLKAGPEIRRAKIGAWLALDYNEPRKVVRIESIDVLRNGQIWNRYVRDEESQMENIEFNIQEKENAWYLVRVRGTDPLGHFAVTSPIWFETPDRKPLEAVTSHVVATVTSPDGAKLGGTVRVIEYSALDRKELARAEFKDGTIALDCPAAARLEITVAGYEPQLLSPFLHGPIYAKMFSGIRRTDLLSNDFYDRVRAELANVAFSVVLRRKKE